MQPGLALPEQLVRASNVNSLPTAMLPAATFGRLITSISVGNSISATVSLYKGSLTGPVVERSLNGQANTLLCRIYLPPGQPFFVRWDASAANIGDAFARFMFEHSEPVADVTYDWTYQPKDIMARFFDVPIFNTAITQTTFFGPYKVVNIDSIGVRAIANGGHGLLILRWAANPDGTQETTFDKISMRDATHFDQTVVVKGSYLTIEAQNVEPADWTLTIVLYETARPTIPQLELLDNELISQVGAAAPVGITNFDLDNGRIWASEAVWFVRSTLATYTARLRAFNHLGTLTTYDIVNNLTLDVPRTTFLPAVPMRIEFNNTTAGAGTVTMMLIARTGLTAA